jgi:hypothetical protein
MPKPVCVPCKRFFRPKRNGTAWIEGKPSYSGAPPGTEEEAAWSPYKLWNSDMWECQGCGAQIIVGHGQQPISQDYMADFADQVKDHGATLQVNDC